MSNVVVITAELDVPIGLNLLGHPDMRYVTLCPITFCYGAETVVVPKGFEFDGPTIPRPLWIFAGFSPADIDTALASCVHDWGCDHPEDLPRALADSIFFETLGPMTFNGHQFGGVDKPRRQEMTAAVVGYSLVSGKDWR